MKLISSGRFIAFMIAIAVVIVSCQGISTSLRDNSTQTANSIRTSCRNINHVMGQTEVCDQPQRIAVLGPYLLESLLALNVQAAGFADHVSFHQGDYDNPTQQILYLGDRVTQPMANIGIAYAPSIEAILKVKPDLILGLDIQNARQYQTLSSIAPTLILKWTDPDMNLRAIAQAVNRSEQAEQILKETKQKIATARQEFASFVEFAPKLLLLNSSELRDVFLVTNRNGLCSSLLKELGFQLMFPPNFPQDSPAPLIPISLETLPQLNQADSVILLGNNFSKPNQLKQANNFEDHQLASLKQAWSKNAIAQSLNVSKSGKVYFIPTYLCLGLPGSIGTDLYLNELKKQLLSTSN